MIDSSVSSSISGSISSTNSGKALAKVSSSARLLANSSALGSGKDAQPNASPAAISFFFQNLLKKY